jgi:hypothetical protein
MDGRFSIKSFSRSLTWTCIDILDGFLNALDAAFGVWRGAEEFRWLVALPGGLSYSPSGIFFLLGNMSRNKSDC